MTKRRPSVFFYVQHLLGIGHLKRSAVIARALASAGFDVTVASGGVPVAGVFPSAVKVVQLPPARAGDASFAALVDEGGRPVDDAWKARRAAALLDAFDAAAPRILLVELFPFGRRLMRFELMPLLERAKGGARIACSVRDLIQPKPAREPEVLEIVERYFDRVLVHGDPALARFERSFAAAPRLGDKLAYTGYVVEDADLAGPQGRGEVLVSAGGGAVGRELLEAALRARPLTSLAERTWRLLCGLHGPAPESFQGEGVVAERMRTDFPVLLANCEVSISQAGYNTVMESLRAGTRAVVVPFAAGGETEQAERARLLAARGLLEVVEEGGLTPRVLAAAVDRAASRPRPAAGAAAPLDLGGATRTAALLKAWLDG